MTKNRTVLLIAAILCITLIFIGCGKEADPNGGETTDQEQPEEGKKFSIEAFGVVLAPEKITVTSEISAMIQRIHADLGEPVAKGDEVITFDLRDYSYDLLTLRSNLNAAELQLEKLRQDFERADTSVEQEYKRFTNQIEITQTELDNLTSQKDDKNELLSGDRDPDIEKIKNDLEKAHSDYQDALVELEENRALFDAEAISEQELKASESSVKDLKNQASGLEYSLEKMLLSRNDELDSIDLQIMQKETVLENLKIEREKLATPLLTEVSIQELEIQRIREQIQNHTKRLEKPWFSEDSLVCPYEMGIVGELFISEGEIIGPGTKLITFLDGSTLEVEGYVPEEFIRDITEGDPVSISPVADPDRSYDGIVNSIATMAKLRNNETVVTVTISVGNEDQFLMPNFNVDITFNPEEKEEEEQPLSSNISR